MNTNERKIKQIIPAPADMYAVYDGVEGNPGYCDRVVCLALMGDGETVRAMVDMGECNYMEFADDVGNFLGFTYDKGIPEIAK